MVADDRIIRPAELRRMFGVSLATIWRMRRRGDLPDPLRISPGVVGWRASVIDEWLDAREREAQADPSPRPPRPDGAHERRT